MNRKRNIGVLGNGQQLLDLVAEYRSMVASLGGALTEIQAEPTLEKTGLRKAEDKGTQRPLTRQHYHIDAKGVIHRNKPKRPAGVSARVAKRQRTAERRKLHNYNVVDVA